MTRPGRYIAIAVGLGVAECVVVLLFYLVFKTDGTLLKARIRLDERRRIEQLYQDAR